VRRRDPATLAALLVAAMPDTRPVAVAPAHASRDDVDVAVVHDADSNVWVVLAPRTPAAGARVEAETEAVRLLAGVLPFDVPRPRADVNLPEGGRAIVFPAPRGRPVDLVRLAASPGVCRSVGRSLAALHDVTTAVVERAGVPVYDAGEVRRRRLSELDRGAATGQVPPVLLQRWEAVLDDTSLWDFSPTVVHGDLVAERLIVTGEEVTAVLDWTDVHVGDPAEDLAWLAVGAEPETVDEVMAAYRSSRHGSVDEDLVRRAVLHGEMALVRWLLHGVTTGEAGVRDDARQMLEQLAGWVEAENEAVMRHADDSADSDADDSDADDSDADDSDADDAAAGYTRDAETADDSGTTADDADDADDSGTTADEDEAADGRPDQPEQPAEAAEAEQPDEPGTPRP
jgi:macrolide phosphotransferase